MIVLKILLIAALVFPLLRLGVYMIDDLLKIRRTIREETKKEKR